MKILPVARRAANSGPATLAAGDTVLITAVVTTLP
jgi:hypothetical protein